MDNERRGTPRHATQGRMGKHQSGLRGRGTEKKAWAFIVLYVEEMGEAVKQARGWEFE